MILKYRGKDCFPSVPIFRKGESFSMNVSTSINVMFGQGPVASQMKRVYDAGFRHMDINFNDWVDQKTGNGYFPCSEEQWQDWVPNCSRSYCC